MPLLGVPSRCSRDVKRTRFRSAYHLPFRVTLLPAAKPTGQYVTLPLPASVVKSVSGHLTLRLRTSRKCALVGALVGGLDDELVLADADLQYATSTIGNAAFAQAGQRCKATSRVVVMDGIFDEFVEKLEAYSTHLTIGDGTAASTQMGPVVNEGHMHDVLRDVEAAVKAHATVVTGGGRLVENGLERGCLVAPSVLVCPQTSDALWQEEIFGPVVALYRAHTEEEAHAAILDTRYGL